MSDSGMQATRAGESLSDFEAAIASPYRRRWNISKICFLCAIVDCGIKSEVSMKVLFDGWRYFGHGLDGRPKGELTGPARATMMSVESFGTTTKEGVIEVRLHDSVLYVLTSIEEFTRDYEAFMNAYLQGRSSP